MAGHSKWANIKHRKGRNDALRAKITTKVSREITVAARMGGGDPTGNMRLKLALQKAKENNIPKDNIQRAIQKGVGATDSAGYDEITYEGYGPGGVAITVEVMTNNRNRTAADVRHAFNKYGGNMGEAGCVAWMFKRKGIFVVEELAADEDELMLLVLDAGAEDFKNDDSDYEIVTSVEDFDNVEKALAENNIATLIGKISMVPDTTVVLDVANAQKMQNLIDVLDDLDDVQDVYTNAEFPEE